MPQLFPEGATVSTVASHAPAEAGGEITASTSPFADAIAHQWGNGPALLAIAAIAVSAFGGLNAMILGTGELAYSMALRGDIPAIFARTRGGNTPQ